MHTANNEHAIERLKHRGDDPMSVKDAMAPQKEGASSGASDSPTSETSQLGSGFSVPGMVFSLPECLFSGIWVFSSRGVSCSCWCFQFPPPGVCGSCCGVFRYHVGVLGSHVGVCTSRGWWTGWRWLLPGCFGFLPWCLWFLRVFLIDVGFAFN